MAAKPYPLGVRLSYLLPLPLVLTALTAGGSWWIEARTGYASHQFLLWNLALAWVPLLVALALYGLHRSSTVLVALLGFMWLLFLPNAPYLVTDLIHYGQLNSHAPHWLDLGTLLAAAGAGLGLGLISLRYVHLALSYRLGRWSSLPVSVAILACGVGVYLGRILRLNSWDVAHPHRVVSLLLPRLENPQSHPLMLGGIAIAITALALAYAAFCRLSPSVKQAPKQPLLR